MLSDNTRLAELFAELLAARRHCLTVCSTLQQAHDACGDRQPAAVLFDADQQSGDPRELYRTLRRAAGPKAIIVALTAREHGQRCRQLVEAGVDDYLVLGEPDRQWLTLRLQLLERAVAKRIGQASEAPAPLLPDALARLLPDLPTMLLVVDRQGLIQCANRGPRDLGRDQLAGQVGFDFLVPRQREPARRILLRTLERGEPHSMAASDIFDLCWDVRLLPFIDGHGEPFALVACHDATSRQEAERTLGEFQEALKHIFDRQEQSCEHVAATLHDEISQQLTSVLFALEALAVFDGRRPELREQATQIARASLQEAIANCRRLAAALTPLGLRKFGLLAAVECLLQELRSRGGPAIPLQVHDQLGRLPLPTELALFRIMEKLAAVAHPLGCDRTVQMTLRRDDHAVCLQFDVHATALEESHRTSLELALKEISVRAKAAGGCVLPPTRDSQVVSFLVRFPLGLP